MCWVIRRLRLRLNPVLSRKESWMKRRHSARKEGIKHVICQSEELEIEGFSKNPPNRCYLCKKRTVWEDWRYCKKRMGLNILQRDQIWMITRLQTRSDRRKKNLELRARYVRRSWRKAEIREYSKELGLPTWDKQSFACLSSRFVYGETISEEKLGMVEKAEQLLLDYGFHQVRVRIHGHLQEFEIMPEEFPKLLEKKCPRGYCKENLRSMDLLMWLWIFWDIVWEAWNETLGEKWIKTTADRRRTDRRRAGNNEKGFTKSAGTLEPSSIPRYKHQTVAVVNIWPSPCSS